MNAFDDGVDALFTDKNLADDAVYTPVSGDAVNIRVVRTTPPQGVGLFTTGAYLPADMADVRISEIQEPFEGDQLTIGDKTFLVRNATRDPERLVWRLDLEIQE